MRMGLYKKRFMQIRCRKKIAVVIFFFLTVFIIRIFFERIYPNYISRIEVYSENLAVSMINSALIEVKEIFLNDYGFSETALNSKETVSFIEEDTGKINLFKAEYVRCLQKKINDTSFGYIKIPLGSLSGREIFSGIGPEIKIKTIPYGVVNADFEEEFVSCGINQVKHKLFLRVKVKITMISATMRKTHVTDEVIPISETVICGDVPTYYGTGITAAVK